MKYHFAPVRMAINKESTNKNVREGVANRGRSCTVGGNAS